MVERPSYDLTVFKIHCGKLTLKMYSKGERVLRIEVIVHNARELRTGRKLEKFPEIVQRLQDILEQRLAVFSADRRKVLEDLIQRDGGVDNLQIAFWGEANKSHRDGGKYHWKIGSATIVCDWQTQGKDHIHMTVRGRAKS